MWKRTIRTRYITTTVNTNYIKPIEKHISETVNNKELLKQSKRYYVSKRLVYSTQFIVFALSGTVLRFTASDYRFGILDVQLLITALVS
jgi:hypothetical protein